MVRIVHFFKCLTFLCAVPAALAAQDDAGPADRGSFGIALGAGSVTSVGLWLRAGERTDLGLEGFFNVSDDDTDADGGASRIVGVRPAVKGYLRDSDVSVAPYWIVGLSFEHTKFELGGGDRTTRSIGGLVGMGLDWYPAERVSLGGHVGLEGATTRNMAPPGLGGSEEETSGFELGTLSSGIRLQVWF